MATPLLFALSGSRDLGQRIAACLEIELARHEERRFEDGEHKLRPLQSVRRQPVFVLSPLHSDPDLSVNDKLMRLALFTGALRDASAAEITLLTPYLAYARKDRRTKPRDPVSLRYLAAMLEAVGADRIVTLEVHNPAAFQNAFRIVTEHLPAAALFVPHLASQFQEGEKIAVVSPDTGGFKRAQDFRQRLEATLGRTVASAFVEKLRSGGELTHGRLVGEVKDHTVLIVDDLIVTGRTLIHAARSCKQAGARQVLAVAAHGLFDASANDLLTDPALERIVISDSVAPHKLKNPAVRAKLECVPTASFFAEALRRIHQGESLNAWLAS